MTTLIFDLDGTLIHTGKIVLPAFHQAIRHFPHIPLPSEAAIQSTFGLPDVQIWEILMPDASLEEREAAYKLSNTYIRKGLFKTDILLKHAREVLETLKKWGYTLTVASNCGTSYLNAVLDSQGIRPYFTRPLCLESVKGKKKADILTEHFLHFPKTAAYMIGDRQSDVEAAHAHGIPAIGCILGTNFGESHELDEADFLIHDLTELCQQFKPDALP